jgi:hypothetical protein
MSDDPLGLGRMPADASPTPPPPGAWCKACRGKRCLGLLLIVGFVCAYLRLEHIYGAAVLFVLGIALLVAALFRFGQEVRIALNTADHYR